MTTQPAMDATLTSDPILPRGWRAAEAMSALGTRLSFVLIAWLLLVDERSWTWAALVVGIQALAYVVATGLRAATGRRVGALRVSVATNLLSAITVAAMAYVYHHGVVVAGLAAVLGALRAVADATTNALSGASAAVALSDDEPQVPPRHAILLPLMLIAGVAIGGLAAWLGPMGALWTLAVVFGLCAATTGLANPVRSYPANRSDRDSVPPGRYAYGPSGRVVGRSSVDSSMVAPFDSGGDADRVDDGFGSAPSNAPVTGPPLMGATSTGTPEGEGDALTGETVEMATLQRRADGRPRNAAGRLVVVVFLATVFSVLAAVALVTSWTLHVFGSADALGVIGGAFVLGAITVGVVLTAAAGSPGRYLALTIGYLVGGGGIAVAVNHVLPAHLLIVAVAFIAGAATASVTPVLGLRLAPTTPARVWRRLSILTTAITGIGVALGVAVGGWVGLTLGLPWVVVTAAGCYLLALVLPIAAQRTWQRLTPRVERPPALLRRSPKLTGRLAVTLAYADGEWLVEVRKGRALLGSRHLVKSAEALSMLSLLGVPALNTRVAEALTNDKAEAGRQVDRMRQELADLETKLTRLNDMADIDDEARRPH